MKNVALSGNSHVWFKALAAAVAVMGVCLAQGADFNVDGRDGAAIQKAIDAAAAAGGGRVVVPAGEYPSRTIVLKSHVELHLEKDAVILGGTNGAAYASFPVKEAKMGRSLVQAWDAEDIAITGEGRIDARGDTFFDTAGGLTWGGRFFQPKPGRPHLLLLYRCRDVRFRGVNFFNSPSWTMRIRLCENLDFDGIKVINDLRFINADGIDFDCCRHVRLRNSEFLTGDDSIIMRAIREKGDKGKFVTEDVEVSDCTLNSACQCIRISCPSDDTVRNCRFRNIRAKGWNGIFFDYPSRYLRADEEGYANIHDIVFDGFTGSFENSAVQIVVQNGVKIRGVRDVLFRNFDVTSKKPLAFRGNVFSPIARIRRESFTLNGERLSDGEFAADCSSEKPLRRPQKGEYNYKPPVDYVPKKFVTVGEKTGVAIQRAIDEVAANATGGTVIVPEGVYPSGSLRLKSHVELRLRKGARVIGGTKSEDYFSFPDEICAVKPERSAKVFVYAWDAEDIAITGEGSIEGNGPAFFDQTKKWGNHWAKPACERPRMVQFVRCKGIRLDGVTFLDSPGWTMLIRFCEDIEADGIRVYADQRIINSDGIDFDGCRRVRVAHCDFRTGDDCLIARAMREKGSTDPVVCEDFVVNDCTLDSTCQAIRIGCPSDDTIRNVRFRNIRMSGWNGIYFNYPARYLSNADCGFMDVRDVVFENFTGTCTGSAIQIDVDPGIRLRAVRDITFRNFDVKSAKPLRFVGNVHTPIENVRLENVTVNGARQADGVVAADCTAAGELKRSASGSWELTR